LFDWLCVACLLDLVLPFPLSACLFAQLLLLNVSSLALPTHTSHTQLHSLTHLPVSYSLTQALTSLPLTSPFSLGHSLSPPPVLVPSTPLQEQQSTFITLAVASRTHLGQMVGHVPSVLRSDFRLTQENDRREGKFAGLSFSSPSPSLSSHPLTLSFFLPLSPSLSLFLFFFFLPNGRTQAQRKNEGIKMNK